jgi:hypothetical protein
MLQSGEFALATKALPELHSFQQVSTQDIDTRKANVVEFVDSLCTSRIECEPMFMLVRELEHLGQNQIPGLIETCGFLRFLTDWC